MSTITDAGLAAGWREQALAALEEGRTAEAHEWLRQALAETTELEWLNDLAVLSHQRGRTDEAEALRVWDEELPGEADQFEPDEVETEDAPFSDDPEFEDE